MKKKYKIVYEREACIGAVACEAVLAERWSISSADGKADLVEGVEKDPGVFEYEFDDDELEKIMESALVCPVNVIHIYDSDGNKLV
tara:strand:- start:4845 stop:5102 length:258 start_codon:yes stop_codon:yes gene_type:complete